MSRKARPRVTNAPRMPADWDKNAPLIAFRVGPITVDGSMAIAEDIVKANKNSKGEVINYVLGRKHANDTVAHFQYVPTLVEAITLASTGSACNGRYKDPHRGFRFEVHWGRDEGVLVVPQSGLPKTFTVQSWEDVLAIFREEFRIEL
jgi:hypothetical protein